MDFSSFKRPMALRTRRSHIIALPSSDPVRTKGSPRLEPQILFTNDVCPRRRLIFSWVSTSKITPVLSAHAVSKNSLSRCQWISRIAPSFPFRVAMFSHFPSIFHRKRSLSIPPEASSSPLKSNLHALTGPPCPVSSIVGASRVEVRGRTPFVSTSCFLMSEDDGINAVVIFTFLSMWSSAPVATRARFEESIAARPEPTP
mmetsp:Transcript_32165/g.59899  ORF Transcript_32165/g.59899 Transcript_32165/m.59899 type:complete len:201 (-) Transcript_32165:8-610(-)